MGIVVTDSITTSSPTDTYATHDADLGKGGYRSVQTYADLLAIPEERKTDGMLCHVVEDNKDHRLVSNGWVAQGAIVATPCINMELTDLVLFMRNGNLMSATIEQFKCVISSINAGGAVPICEANVSAMDGGFLNETQILTLDGGASNQVIVQSVDGGTLI